MSDFHGREEQGFRTIPQKTAPVAGKAGKTSGKARAGPSLGCSPQENPAQNRTWEKSVVLLGFKPGLNSFPTDWAHLSSPTAGSALGMPSQGGK